MISCCVAHAAEYETRQIAEIDLINKRPDISENGKVTWFSFSTMTNSRRTAQGIIKVYENGAITDLKIDLQDDSAVSMKPFIKGNRIVWVHSFIGERSERYTLQDPPPLAATNQVDGTPLLIDNSESRGNGDSEIIYWDGKDDPIRLTHDLPNDIAPSCSETLIAWQKARGWPFGWEIMLYDGNETIQLTTNYYYDMAPKVHENEVVWYGWDGNDYEIFHYDHSTKAISQITDNLYDDVAPVVHNGMVAWEGYPTAESDIFLWDGAEIKKISLNAEDDQKPAIHDGVVAWQGFDGNDYEIYMYQNGKTIKLTSNTYDDMEPQIADGTVCWVGYHDNWDGEIFTWDSESLQMLTDNEYDDLYPRTANGKIVWQAKEDDYTFIFLSTPKED